MIDTSNNGQYVVTILDFYVKVWLGGGPMTDRAPDTGFYTHAAYDGSTTDHTDPQETNPIPEFATIAIPVVSILGLRFLFNHCKRRIEQ